MNVSTHSNFGFTSDLLSLHEDASIVGTPDITILLKQKVDSKQISPWLENTLVTNTKS